MAKRQLAKAPSGKEKRQTKARRTTWIVSIGLAVVIGGLIALLIYQNQKPPEALAGKPAPDFTLKLLNGQSVTLSSLKGKPVVLNFWAST